MKPKSNSTQTKLRLTDVLADKPDKTYVGLGVASAVLALESVLVLVKRIAMETQ